MRLFRSRAFSCRSAATRGKDRAAGRCGAPTDRPASKRPAEKGGVPFRDDMVPAAQEKRERAEEVRHTCGLPRPVFVLPFGVGSGAGCRLTGDVAICPRRNCASGSPLWGPRRPRSRQGAKTESRGRSVRFLGPRSVRCVRICGTAVFRKLFATRTVGPDGISEGRLPCEHSSFLRIFRHGETDRRTVRSILRSSIASLR